MSAEDELGTSYVTNVLSWLKNSWKNNPVGKFEEYSLIARRDYNWFCSNVGKNVKYFRLKQKLYLTLQTEYKRLLLERKIQLHGDRKSEERFLLVIY